MSMAFLPDITSKLGERVGVPIVNPVLAALKVAEALVSMRLTHSKQAWPPPKLEEIACGPRGQARPPQA
jgi:allantoin racemase